MNILTITIPLFSSFAIFFLGRYLGQKGAVMISIISIGVSMIIGIKSFYKNMLNNEESILYLYNWINIGNLNIPLAIIEDKYTSPMVFLITTITFIVITYSSWYMKEDPHKNRFLTLLLMFAVTMLILVSSSNLFFLFVGWEGVGVLSFLLINFWYYSNNSNKSALKAILYNKIGDIGIIIGMSIILLTFGNLNISTLSFISCNPDSLFTILLFSLLLGAIAKSAQIFLHPWLGDAMAGPTPVSALLHAATMVTAGVFLLFRLEGLIGESELIKRIIIFIGLFTIIFGGLSSINQNDIKKLIAYSTCSQLGYMFLTNGLLLPELGLFHLITHGFFKALLFLTAGIIIHNFHHEQDLRKFGGFIFSFPISYLFFLIGSLSILSFPFLSGFFSKEAILESSLAPQFPSFIYLLMVIGAIFTSIYSFKLIFFTFFSKPNHSLLLSPSVHELPSSLTLLLSLLLLGSIFLGFFLKDFFFFNNLDTEFLPNYIKLIPLILSIMGIGIAFIVLNPWKYYFLLTIFNRRFFFDSIFNSILALPLLSSAYLFSFKLIDRGLLEYFGPVGLFRILYTLPLYHSKYLPQSQFSHEHIYQVSEKKGLNNLFLYLFLTFFSLLSLLFLS